MQDGMYLVEAVATAQAAPSLAHSCDLHTELPVLVHDSHNTAAQHTNTVQPSVTLCTREETRLVILSLLSTFLLDLPYKQ